MSGELDATPELIRTIHEFISRYKQVGTFLLTHRRNGRPIMRPVATFVEGWTISTITAGSELKTEHVRRNPVVGYLWTDLAGRPEIPWSPRNVWVYGTAELIDDSDEIAAFFRRRGAAVGEGDTAAGGSWQPLLIRTRPEYLRAEGFAPGTGKQASQLPIILRSFDDRAVVALRE